MSDCKRFLHNRARLNNDCCETTWKNTTNKYLANYALDCPAKCEINPNFVCEVGLFQQLPPLLCGNAKFDSELKNGCVGNLLTHSKEKRSLPVRPYRTVPFMGECRTPLMDTDTYSMLISGESTRTHKSCNTQARAERWIPQVPCIRNNIQNPRHYIPKYWVRGGMDTSSYYRNIDYLKACGYKQCPSECEQLFSPDRTVPERIKRQKLQGMNLPCMPGKIPLISRK